MSDCILLYAWHTVSHYFTWWSYKNQKLQVWWQVVGELMMNQLNESLKNQYEWGDKFLDSRRGDKRGRESIFPKKKKKNSGEIEPCFIIFKIFSHLFLARTLNKVAVKLFMILLCHICRYQPSVCYYL